MDAPRLTGQTLLFDADDTLWENNIYFERAIASFITYLDHRTHTPAEVRERLNACEHATIAEHGYGLTSFRRSLIDCLEQLTGTPLTEAGRAHHPAQIVNFTRAIAEQEMELLPAVATTLTELATTWMIGNSPKSDINPSLAAGLNAVFLPHDCTWVLEHEHLDAAPAPRQLLQLPNFAALLTVF
jgi:putative hydrolase of the HAD superfamily